MESIAPNLVKAKCWSSGLWLPAYSYHESHYPTTDCELNYLMDKTYTLANTSFGCSWYLARRGYNYSHIYQIQYKFNVVLCMWLVFRVVLLVKWFDYVNAGPARWGSLGRYGRGISLYRNFRRAVTVLHALTMQLEWWHHAQSFRSYHDQIAIVANLDHF